MEINEEKDLEMVSGGAVMTVNRSAEREVCEVCGRKKFTFYLGMGGRAVCQKCGHAQIVLEWFND